MTAMFGDACVRGAARDQACGAPGPDLPCTGAVWYGARERCKLRLCAAGTLQNCSQMYWSGTVGVRRAAVRLCTPRAGVRFGLHNGYTNECAVSAQILRHERQRRQHITSFPDRILG